MRCNHCNGLLKVLMQQASDSFYECLRCKAQYVWRMIAQPLVKK
jgi:phage FluMu protein Com